MIVMKFDAGSIASEDRLHGVARLVQQRLPRKPVVVTSALPKVTDMLLEGAHEAVAREAEHEDRLEEIRQEHEKVARGLVPEGPARKRLLGHIGALVDELRTYLHRRLLARGADAAHARRGGGDRRAALVRAHDRRARARPASAPRRWTRGRSS